MSDIDRWYHSAMQSIHSMTPKMFPATQNLWRRFVKEYEYIEIILWRNNLWTFLRSKLDIWPPCKLDIRIISEQGVYMNFARDRYAFKCIVLHLRYQRENIIGYTYYRYKFISLQRNKDFQSSLKQFCFPANKIIDDDHCMRVNFWQHLQIEMQRQI